MALLIFFSILEYEYLFLLISLWGEQDSRKNYRYTRNTRVCFLFPYCTVLLRIVYLLFQDKILIVKKLADFIIRDTSFRSLSTMMAVGLKRRVTSTKNQRLIKISSESVQNSIRIKQMKKNNVIPHLLISVLMTNNHKRLNLSYAI